MNKNITIICSTHGAFEQTPNNHLKRGCVKCNSINLIKHNKLDNKQFIKKANLIHKDRYDYSLLNYINAKTKVSIICKMHGEFEQLSSNHLGGHGCPKCASDYINKYNTKSTKDFISEASKLYGDKYDYSKTKYINSKTKVIIICKLFGEFKQTAYQHLNGILFPVDKINGVLIFNKKSNTKEFILKANKIHKNKYDYSLVKYKDSHTKVAIICPIHGEFKQSATSHLNGRGCPVCGGEKSLSYTKRYKGVKTALYYLRVESIYGILYKIGITSRNIQTRYKYELSNASITILKEKWFDDGMCAFREEQEVIENFKAYKYKGDKVFDYTNNKEIFTCDVLNLDNLYL